MSQIELQLTAGNNKGDREGTDFYPTPPDVTATLASYLIQHKILDPGACVWEPAAGDGRMSNVLCNYGFRVQSSDKFPRAYGIHEWDYLTDSPYRDINFDAVITNPPFKLSEQFIRKSIATAPVVCMLLKSQYWHSAKRHKLFSELMPALILPLTWRPDFLFGQKGSSPTMEVIWTVWIKGLTRTEYVPINRVRY